MTYIHYNRIRLKEREDKLMTDYEQFVESIKRKTSIDLALYKEAQMKRRLTSLYEKKAIKASSIFIML